MTRGAADAGQRLAGGASGVSRDAMAERTRNSAANPEDCSSPCSRARGNAVIARGMRQLAVWGLGRVPLGWTADMAVDRRPFVFRIRGGSALGELGGCDAQAAPRLPRVGNKGPLVLASRSS